MLEKRKGIPAKKGYFTTKSTQVVRYDSMTELAMMMYFETTPLRWQKNTKLRIPYVFEGKNRNYIPDFIITARKDAPAQLLEIKGSNDKPELPFKCAAAEEYCKKCGMEFKLIPYDEVRNFIDWKLVQEYHKKQENDI